MKPTPKRLKHEDKNLQLLAECYSALWDVVYRPGETLFLTKIAPELLNRLERVLENALGPQAFEGYDDPQMSFDI